MVAKTWRLCSGDAPTEVVEKLELLSRLGDELRTLTVALLAELVRLADQHGAVEIADAAHTAGVEIGNQELPLVALQPAGTA